MGPLVGITLRPRRDGGQRRLFQNAAYFDAVSASGGVPVGIPLLDDDDALRAVYERCDAVLLPGGPDVEPSHYGEETRADCDVDVEPELDHTELRLARWAAEDDRPLLGICRGAQLLNVALGGALWQDIAVQLGGDINHDRHDAERHLLSHSIEVVDGTRLGAIAPAVVQSNSLHHQAIRRLAASLTASAYSPDGLIEAVEGADSRFLLAVQSHPEELVSVQDWARRLFDEFVAAAR
jgi:putative glutamine amidotransferase